MSALLLIRWLNIVLALIALGLNADKMIRYRLWRFIEMDALFRWFSLFGLLLSYAMAASLAIIADVPTGLWTVVWTPPLAWAVISGFLSRTIQPSGKDVKR